ncbi:MAG: hypothetical protein EOP45_07850 [Sphingobacteriaceae bacterium]|nr:MAG: hypothetical protein EOP45_07850 [Sphingobacteriaceae bacterium]
MKSSNSFTSLFLILFLLIISACSGEQNVNGSKTKIMSFTEADVLHKLDLAFSGLPADDYPVGSPQDVKYNSFLDLEHGYCETAGSRIHLYADKKRWAIVFEKCGYQNRGNDAEIELDYVGNCIDYVIETYPERSYITNTSSIVLISPEEYERISSKNEDDFELISPAANSLTIRGHEVPIEQDKAKYLVLGIHLRHDDNPQHLIGYGDLVRFLSATNPLVMSANDQEVRQHIPQDIPKLMTIDHFHFSSFYDKEIPPSAQETYQLIAKVLVTGDSANWKPKFKPNNHWSNWESGNL